MGISKELISKIKDLYMNGLSCVQIANLVGLSESTVRSVIIRN